MALQTTFNRLKREVGIKRCVILDGNVGDVYLNDKKQIVDLKQYLTDMLKGMEYDDVLYWDRMVFKTLRLYYSTRFHHVCQEKTSLPKVKSP